MNKLLFGGTLAVALIAQPALAVTGPKPKTISYSTSNLDKLPSWTTAEIIQNFESAQTTSPWSDRFKPASYTTKYGKVTEATTGNVYLDTQSNGNDRLEITSGSSYTLKISKPIQFLSFLVTSFSSADSVTLTYANLSTRTLTGGEIFGKSVNNVISSTTRVNFDMGGLSGITQIAFKNGDDCNSFFIDGIAAAAPEPATWGMMIVGFGLAGASLRRRRKVSVAYA